VVSLQEAFGAMAVAATKYEAATDAELLAMNNDLGVCKTKGIYRFLPLSLPPSLSLSLSLSLTFAGNKQTACYTSA